MTATPTALRIMDERKTDVCECCGINPAEEAHHCLHHRIRGKHPKAALDMTFNLQLVCHKCHVSGKANIYSNRVIFLKRQCNRYGADVMLKWYEGVGLKAPEKYFIRIMKGLEQ